MEICGAVLICAAFFCFLIGGVMFLTRGLQTAAARKGGCYAPGQSPDLRDAAAPLAMGTVQEVVKGKAQRMYDETMAAPVHPSPLRKTGHPMHDQFIQARLGQNITVNHPQRGSITGKILGSIRYTELWQRTNAPSEPWVPTGNEFTAHWLGNFMIYEWQERVYLLDEYEALTDQDIQANFLPAAKKFAQSDQSAQVSFAWPPAAWTIVDIGKFTVARAEGSGLRLNQGATGRFIHGTGADNRAIVVEDYQSGSGGQDTAWTGWGIAWDKVMKVE